MLKHKNAKLWSTSEDKSEYKKLRRTLSGENKDNCLNPNEITECTLKNALNGLAKKSAIYVIHDPCDIRKDSSKQLEHIGKVRALDGKIINGYNSFNSIAISPKGKRVTLLDHFTYSNKEPSFLREEDIKKFHNKRLSSDDEIYKNIETRLSTGDFINKNKITKNRLQKTHDALKGSNPAIEITHIMDREFDSENIFNFIDKDLNDKFVIRLKGNRITDDKDENGKNILLVNSDKFNSNYDINIPKLMIKNKCYQDVIIKLECSEHMLFNVLRVNIYARNGKSIFKKPMLLITNKNAGSKESALCAYVAYLKRGKIEYVFKFIKETLGWEEIRLKDFQSIKNMLSICYFVAAYFFELSDELVNDDLVIMLADLGGGKGRTTRFYVLKGLSRLLNKYAVDSYIKKHKLTNDDVDELYKYAGVEPKK